VKKKVDNILRRTAKFGSMDEEYSLYCKCFNGECVGFTAAPGQSLLTRENFMALAPQTVNKIVINYICNCEALFGCAELQVLLYGSVNVQFCAADDFVRNRNLTNMERVVTWIQRSGYDLTKPLRAEVGLAQESKVFFTEENCIPVGDAGEDIEVMFCRVLRGRPTVHLIL
jgi:hypothetical protein